jgi:hypothetical protein
MGITADKSITFEMFPLLNDQYPALFSPAFSLQNSLRQRILGVDWWFKKLSKYKEVRSKMSAEGQYAEEAVQLELERFENELKRQERVANRAKLIEGETGLRKGLLQVQQFIDEVQEDT